MNHEVRRLTDELRAARERKGLSQRALTSRIGLPQSHISKIEKGDANPTISSITAIANALGLEFVLVPRKAVSVVKAVSESLEEAQPPRDVLREFARIAKYLDHIEMPETGPLAAGRLRRSFRALRSLENHVRDPAPLRRIGNRLRTAMTSEDTQALREVKQQMDSMRHALAHADMEEDRRAPPRPAYRLDEEHDE